MNSCFDGWFIKLRINVTLINPAKSSFFTDSSRDVIGLLYFSSSPSTKNPKLTGLIVIFSP